MSNHNSPVAKLAEFEQPDGVYEQSIHQAAIVILRNYPFTHQQFEYVTQWANGATVWRSEKLGFSLTISYAPISQELDIEKTLLTVTATPPSHFTNAPASSLHFRFYKRFEARLYNRFFLYFFS